MDTPRRGSADKCSPNKKAVLVNAQQSNSGSSGMTHMLQQLSAMHAKTVQQMYPNFKLTPPSKHIKRGRSEQQQQPLPECHSSEQDGSVSNGEVETEPKFLKHNAKLRVAALEQLASMLKADKLVITEHDVFEPVHTPTDNHGHAYVYRRQSTLSEYIEAVSASSWRQHWGAFNQTSNLELDTEYLLRGIQQHQSGSEHLPYLQRDMSIWCFKNGLYDSENHVFHPFPITDDTFRPVARYYIDQD